MSIKKWFTRTALVAVVLSCFCLNSIPTSASTTSSYRFDPCKAAQNAINYLLFVEDQIEAYALQHPDYAQQAADAVEDINKLIAAIGDKYGSCKLDTTDH